MGKKINNLAFWVGVIGMLLLLFANKILEDTITQRDLEIIQHRNWLEAQPKRSDTFHYTPLGLDSNTKFQSKELFIMDEDELREWVQEYLGEDYEEQTRLEKLLEIQDGQ